MSSQVRFSSFMTKRAMNVIRLNIVANEEFFICSSSLLIYIDKKSVSRCRNTPSSGTAKNLHRKCHKQATHAVYLFRYAQHERYAYNSSVFLYAKLAVSTKGGKVITLNLGSFPKATAKLLIKFYICEMLPFIL